VRYYRDQTRPQLDLVGTYTTDGLAGTLVSNPNSTRGTNPLLLARVNELSALAGLPPLTITTTTSSPAANLIGGYTQSLRNLFEQRYPTARVGVVISLPLRNRTAEANLGRSLAQGSRINDQIKQQEQLIEADVRNSVQAVRSAEARLAASAASRASAEQQYESQQRQFRAGTTTVFLVLQAQTTLLQARASELQAQTALNKAISQLQHATGNTLEANNVAVLGGAPARELGIREPPSPDSGNTGGAFVPPAAASSAAPAVGRP
jgi:HAE1 family hydrophobic/amphiphilic exporter-1